MGSTVWLDNRTWISPTLLLPPLLSSRYYYCGESSWAFALTTKLVIDDGLALFGPRLWLGVNNLLTTTRSWWHIWLKAQQHFYSALCYLLLFLLNALLRHLCRKMRLTLAAVVALAVFTVTSGGLLHTPTNSEQCANRKYYLFNSSFSFIIFTKYL